MLFTPTRVIATGFMLQWEEVTDFALISKSFYMRIPFFIVVFSMCFIPAEAEPSFDSRLKQKRFVIMEGCDSQFVEAYYEGNGRGQVEWDRLIAAAVRAADSKNYNLSQSEFEKALLVARKLGNRDLIRRSLDNLAWAYIQTKHYALAESVYKEMGKRDIDMAKLLLLENKNIESDKILKTIDPTKEIIELRLKCLRKTVEHREETAFLAEELDWLKQNNERDVRNFIEKKQFLKSPEEYKKNILRQIHLATRYLDDRNTSLSFQVMPNGTIKGLKVKMKTQVFNESEYSSTGSKFGGVPESAETQIQRLICIFEPFPEFPQNWKTYLTEIKITVNHIEEP